MPAPKKKGLAQASEEPEHAEDEGSDEETAAAAAAAADDDDEDDDEDDAEDGRADVKFDCTVFQANCSSAARFTRADHAELVVRQLCTVPLRLQHKDRLTLVE